MKRLLAIVLLALALAGCRYVPPATHVYCYGEGGQAVVVVDAVTSGIDAAGRAIAGLRAPTCVSQGSEGRP